MTLQEQARFWAYRQGTGELVDATLAARERTGIHISTQVKQGSFRVVSVVYGKKDVVVTPISEWTSKEGAIEVLEAL